MHVRTASLTTVLALTFVAAIARGDELQDLRNQYANRFLEPAAHFALAKYHHDRGNRLLAFYLLESARRTRFEKEIFDVEFRRTFSDEEPFDNSAENEARLLERLRAAPKDPKLLSEVADIYISRDDFDSAQRYLKQALKLDRANSSFVQALAEIQRRSGDDRAAEKLLLDHAKKNPDSEDGYLYRASKYDRKETAAALKLLSAAVKAFPQSGPLRFTLAAWQQQAGAIPEAATSYDHAARLDPKSARIQGWTGRFFLKEVQNREAALEYYLSAYFLDPHFYDSEHAEFRIFSINEELADGIFLRALESGPSGLITALHHENPAVVMAALKHLSESSIAGLENELFSLMEHDEPMLRFSAMGLLYKQAPGVAGRMVPELLGADDLRKRGAAAYLAVETLGKDAFPMVRRFLASDCQLLRFDAASALVLHGGVEGRQIVLDHRNHEPDERFVKLIDSLSAEPTSDQDLEKVMKETFDAITGTGVERR